MHRTLRTSKFALGVGRGLMQRSSLLQARFALALLGAIALCGCAAEPTGSGPGQVGGPGGGAAGTGTPSGAMGGPAAAGGAAPMTGGNAMSSVRDAGAGAPRGKGATDAATASPAPDAQAAMRDAGGGPPADAGAIVPGTQGYLHTQGSKIVDSQGNEVRLTGLSWFGMETASYAPHGLWSRSLGSMLDQIKSLGYNMIRLPFCSQFFDGGSTPQSIDMAKNPDLQGLRGIALMDKVVEGARQRGLKIILDRHRPDSNAQSALWYTSQYSEQRFIDDWKMLATHYKGNATVIGMDLHNEPHDPATWGDGNMMTDWRLAAERAGNAILTVNPQLLIIVEGVQTVDTSNYWWGGNLRAAGDHPVRLSVRDRLVYSPHDYPQSVHDQSWFGDSSYPSNLPRVWHDAWGYLADEGIAPIWIGEFGTKNQTGSDQQWFQALASYIAQRQLSFSFWCLNPDSGDTGGILQDDWNSVNQDKQSVLQPLLAPAIP
jgi:endoglucanase